MDCKAFHDKHIAYVDDTLPYVEMIAMREHLHRCRRCSRHDVAVRRALLMVHNLPSIEPSADFRARLDARIRQLQQAGATPRPAHAPAMGTFAAIAAGVALAAYLALETFVHLPPGELRLPPVVATAPEPPATPVSSPAFVASVSTGMPVWPTVMMLEQQASLHAGDFDAPAGTVGAARGGFVQTSLSR